MVHQGTPPEEERPPDGMQVHAARSDRRTWPQRRQPLADLVRIERIVGVMTELPGLPACYVHPMASG